MNNSLYSPYSSYCGIFSWNIFNHSDFSLTTPLISDFSLFPTTVLFCIYQEKLECKRWGFSFKWVLKETLSAMPEHACRDKNFFYVVSKSTFFKAYSFPRFVPTYVSMTEVTFLHLYGFVAVPNFQDELERCKLYAVGLRGVPLGVSDLSFGRVEMTHHSVIVWKTILRSNHKGYPKILFVKRLLRDCYLTLEYKKNNDS